MSTTLTPISTHNSTSFNTGSAATKAPITITKRITYQGESYDCSLQSVVQNTSNNRDTDSTFSSSTPQTPTNPNHHATSSLSASSTPRIRWQLKIFSVRLNEMYTCTVGNAEYATITRNKRNVVKQPAKLFQLVKDALFQQQPTNSQSKDESSSQYHNAAAGKLTFDMFFSSNASLDASADFDAILQDDKTMDPNSMMANDSFSQTDMLISHDELLRKGTENYHRAKMVLRIEYADQYVVEGFHFWIVLTRHTAHASKVDVHKKLRKENKQMLHSLSMLQIENKTQNHVIQSIQTDMSILQQDHQNQSIQSQILQSDFKQLRKENKHLTEIVSQLSSRIKTLEEQNSKVLKENATIKQYIQNIIALQGASKKSTSTMGSTSAKNRTSTDSMKTPNRGSKIMPNSPASGALSTPGTGGNDPFSGSTLMDEQSLQSGEDYSNLPEAEAIQLDTFWDPDKTYIGVGLSNQNRTAVNTKKYWTSCLANGVLMSGCYRVSIRLDNVGYRNSICIGVSDPNIALINTRCGDTERSWGLNCYDGFVLHDGQKKAYLHVKEETTSVEIHDGTMIHMLIDMDAQTLSYQIGDVDFGVAFRNVVGPVAPMCSLGDYGVSASVIHHEV